MAAEIGDSVWGTFLDQHNSIVSLLDTHASLLVEMRKVCEDKSETRFLILGRLNTTEKLIATFKQSIESLQEITKRDIQAEQESSKPPEVQIPPVPIRETKKPKSQRPVKAVPDPSGFFTIDPNPTPLEQLYNDKASIEKRTTAVKAKANGKRKVEADHPPRAEPVEEGPKRKKSKKTNERKGPPAPTVEDDKEEQPDDEVSDDDDEAFVKAVAARNEAKEKMRQAKDRNKRKRQSEESAEGVNGTTTKKKRGKRQSKAEATAQVPAAPASVGTEQKKQQTGKRGFAQADSEDDDEMDVDCDEHPGRKKKRTRTKKSKV